MSAAPAFDRPPGRVAMVRMSAIGDTVHAMPVAASIRRAWPDCHLTWVIQPVPLGLMRGRPDVDEFLVFHRERGIRAYRDFRREARGRRFDLVLGLHPNFKGGVATRMLRAPLRVGFDRARAGDLSWLATNRHIPPRPPQHVQDEYFEFLEWLGIPVVEEWDFHFTEEERAAARQWRERMGERPVLAVATRSSRRAKDWTLDRYVGVLDTAAGEFGLRTVLVGGMSAGERADAEALREACRFPPEVELRYDLRELAWILDASDALLSPDTGPLHMAVALGTPTIGLYAFTDPGRVGPYGRFGDLLVDRYSRPGGGGPHRAGEPGDMTRITTEDVIEKLEVLRDRYLKGSA